MNSVGTRKEDGLGADASQPGPLHSLPGQVGASIWRWTAASSCCRGARRSPAAAGDRAKRQVDSPHQTRIGARPRRTERRGEGKARQRPRSRRTCPTGRRGRLLSPPPTAPTAHDSVLRPHIRRITHASSCLCIHHRADRRRGLQQELDHDPGAGGQHGAPFRGRPPRALGACEVWE